MEIIIFWLIFSIGVAFLANSRGRNGFGFFLLSILLSPLLGLIVVLVTANLKEVEFQELQKKISDEKEERLRREEHERQIESIKALAKSNSGNVNMATSGSLADEIRKLGQLRSEGLLTDAEFEQQKERLLGNGTQTQTIQASLPTQQLQNEHGTENEAWTSKRAAAVLEKAGYQLKTKGASWEVCEPLGGRKKIESVEELIEYAKGKER